MNLAFISIVLLLAPSLSLLEGNSRIQSPEIVANNSPEAIVRAQQQGTTTALADIKAGRPVILYFGKPWSADKPLIDDDTGLPVEIVAGCEVGKTFVAEVTGYNDTIRAWHAKQAEQKAAQKK